MYPKSAKVDGKRLHFLFHRLVASLTTSLLVSNLFTKCQKCVDHVVL